MRKPDSPCLDCENRCIGCKSYCTVWMQYVAKKAQYEAVIAASKKEQRDYNAVRYRCVIHVMSGVRG